MAFLRNKLTIAASAVVLGAGGYFLYSVFALQGQGALAQAPLNVQSGAPTAFIMAVDDSGSMTFETLLPGRDGQAFWDNATAGTNGFFDSSNRLRTSGDAINPRNDSINNNGTYNHLLPYVGHRIDATRFAIPPIDNFGFARSPEYNPAYFNPAVAYPPWKRPNTTTSLIEDYPQASVTATRPEPNAAAPLFNLGIVHFDRTDDGDTVPTEEERFVVPQGATLPAGTRYYTTASCGGLGTSPATRNVWATVPSGGIQLTDDCLAGIAYVPATFYLKTTTPAPAGYVAGRTLATNACGNGCNMYRYEITGAMFGTAAPAMLQKFANWLSFYGDRNRAMIAGLTQSFTDLKDMRVGMFTINNRNSVVMRDMNIFADKAALYSGHFLALPASGSTPNRFAVDHIGAQFQRSTGSNLPVQLECQRNVGMLFTDGYSNQGSPTGIGNVDGSMPIPLRDGYADTLADIAAKYYLANLRPDMTSGQVRIPEDACTANPNDPRLDCREDLHMNFFGVTLGARGDIFGTSPYVDDPGTSRNEATEAAFASAPAWQTWENDQPSTVDEIWHATMNGRGEFINAQTPADITSAMRRVLGAAGPAATPAGSIALTGARIGAGSMTVEPFYESANDGMDWYGKLTAYEISTDLYTRVVTSRADWEASDILSPTGRNVWFTNGSNTVLPFDAANLGSLNNLCNSTQTGMSVCTGAELAALRVGGLTVAQAVSYLKGNQSLEVNVDGDNGDLRYRSSILGDIVNSTPIISAPTDDYGYRSLGAPYGTSYSTYMTSKAGRRPMVYVGANDGMLHAFDGRLRANGGGVERFAFVPNGVLGHMGNLLFPYVPEDGNDQKFQHRYYVDGPIVVSDAHYAGGWETVLVGTTGAGAKGVFALNVSDAANPTSTQPFSASDRLWEISDQNASLTATQRNNIGNVLGKPVIVPVKTGSGTGPVKWRAIFGNGYNSASGKAVLYLVDIDTGSPNITMIEAVESGSNVPPGTNGLGNIVVTDRWAPATNGSLTLRSRDGYADTVYAADQKGAIWKFDLRDATPANQTRPVFTTLRYTSGPATGYRQPILGGLAAAAGPGGGVLVYFGTGSFSFNNDPSDTTLQSLYAVLDRSTGTPTTTMTRSNLLQQTIVDPDPDDEVRPTSTTALAYGALSGWYLDLPNGERSVGYPRIESGIVFMPTYDPRAVGGCGTNGKNWLFGLNALSGAASLSNVRVGSPTGSPYDTGTGAIALDTSGTAPVKDVAVMTSPRVQPLVPDPDATEEELEDQLDQALAAQCSMIVKVAGAPPLYLPRACGRQSWRQIQ